MLEVGSVCSLFWPAGGWHLEEIEWPGGPSGRRGMVLIGSLALSGWNWLYNSFRGHQSHIFAFLEPFLTILAKPSCLVNCLLVKLNVQHPFLSPKAIHYVYICHLQFAEWVVSSNPGRRSTSNALVEHLWTKSSRRLWRLHLLPIR